MSFLPHGKAKVGTHEGHFIIIFFSQDG